MLKEYVGWKVEGEIPKEVVQPQKAEVVKENLDEKIKKKKLEIYTKLEEAV
jgi:hypothetical protein